MHLHLNNLRKPLAAAAKAEGVPMAHVARKAIAAHLGEPEPELAARANAPTNPRIVGAIVADLARGRELGGTHAEIAGRYSVSKALVAKIAAAEAKRASNNA